MTTILLIRHAENDYIASGRLPGRLPGVHLNDRGRQQAEALAEALAKAPIETLYSSPLERCLETAQPLAAALGLEILPREGLIELDPGEWQDRTIKELSRLKRWKIVQSNPSRMQFPGGETFAGAQQRIVQELESLHRRHDHKSLIACFSHSDPIKLAVSYYLGQPLDLFQRITVSPASISAVHLDEMGTRIISVNQSVSLNFPQPRPKGKL